jgi:hypothetical protein
MNPHCRKINNKNNSKWMKNIIFDKDNNKKQQQPAGKN